jgi:amino acid adenylation domain-containing protein
MQPLQYKTTRTDVSGAESQPLGAWNNTQQSFPKDFCAHQLVSKRAQATPEAIAVRDGSRSITYAELESQSNRLANYLRAKGVGPDVLVGLCVERTALMAVGALGVLKAGGAYVPVDPSYPMDRIAFMLSDARPRVLITQNSLVERLSAEGRELVVLDRESPEIAKESASAPTEFSKVDDLAYVIYTSGSTGQPKGVQITHGNLLNLIFWHQDTFGVTPADRATQIASPGFDATVWEIWPYLTAGASVHFVPECKRTEPEGLRDWLVEKEITICFLPTPLAERIIPLEWPPNASLRVLLTGADTLHHYPSVNLPFVLINNYGPTECTVVATSGPVPSRGQADQLPSIGRPIWNTQIYILDNEMNPVLPGSAGELHIGGAGLSRGYINRPDLTSQKFVPNPFSSVATDHLYKTGDLARFLPDGQIEFLGRVDDQVKIRGFRIELNEVIGALSRHPAIRENVVVTALDGKGEKRLVAYIVASSLPAPTSGDLRSFMGEKLPDYMIPTAFISLDELPIGPNGKVDRNALPAPDDTNIMRDGDFLEPRTPVEQRIASIVGPLLGLERVGVSDNFFLLGGNSLLGTQVIARVRGAFGVELSLLSLFDNPTIAGIATEVEQLIIAKVDAMSEDEAQSLMTQGSEEKNS